MLRSLASAAAAAMLAGCSVIGVRTVEEPPHTVVSKLSDGVEIREYGPRVAADTVVAATDAGDGDASDKAFRLLFDYISGANAGETKIAMTAPVAVEKTKIAMTAPVQTTIVKAGQGEADGERGWFGMRFFLPSSYTIETAPRPTDARVRLTQVPAQTLAVLRFTGSRDRAAVDERRQELKAALNGTPWQPQGEAVALFYDPPWTLWFLRRNEVAVEVTRRP